MASVFHARAAVAQEIATVTTTESEISDAGNPLLAGGIGLTAVGAVAIAAGAGMFADAEDIETCGITGCFETTGDKGQELAAASLLGAGVGVAAVGVPALLAGALATPPAHGHVSDSRMTTGLVLSAMGAGGVGAGIGFAARLSQTPGHHWTLPGLLIGNGLGHLAVGVPLTITGAWARTAQGEVDAARWAELDAKRVRRNEPLMYTGLSLIGSGLFAGGTNAALFAATHESRSQFGPDESFLFMLGMGTAGALVLTGIPLAAAGGSRVVDPRLVPTVSASPSSMQLDWRF